MYLLNPQLNRQFPKHLLTKKVLARIRKDSHCSNVSIKLAISYHSLVNQKFCQVLPHLIAYLENYIKRKCLAAKKKKRMRKKNLNAYLTADVNPSLQGTYIRG